MHHRSLKKQVVSLLFLIEDAIVLDLTTQHVLVKRLQYAIEQRGGRVLLFQFYFLVLPRYDVEYGWRFLGANNVGADGRCFGVVCGKRTRSKGEKGKQGG